MQKTIYIKDEQHWELIKGVAKGRNLSVSKLIQDIVGSLVNESQLDRIESKLDQLICGFGDRPMGEEGKIDRMNLEYQEKMSDGSGPVLVPEKSVEMDVDPAFYEHTDTGSGGSILEEKTEAEIIAEGQANLDATRKARGIKIDKMKGRVESVTGFSGSYSKEHQSRKQLER